MVNDWHWRNILTASAGVALTALLGCTSPERGPEFTLEQEEWNYRGTAGKILKTPHFTIHTTIQDPVMVEIMPDFAEASYRRYEKLMPGGASDRDPLRSYVFEQRRQWNQFTRDFANPRRVPIYLRIQSGGYSENAVGVLYLIGRERTLSVFAHEGFHQYVASRFDETIPPWLNEGLACYCEAFQMDGMKPVFTPDHNTFRMNNLRTALNAKELVPLKEILDTHAGNIIRLGGRKVASYYAQAWALVTFLRHGKNKQYVEGFRKLLDDAGTSRMRQAADAFRAASSEGDVSYGAACFRHYVCDDVETFEEDYKAFLLPLVGFSSSVAVGRSDE